MKLVQSSETTLKLFPFQAEDTEALQDRKSVLLAWEMGTGKTYAGIELDLRHRALRRAEGFGQLPTLVVAPLSTLESTWAEHFEELTDLDYVVIDPKKRDLFVKAIKNKIADVYIMHWEALRLVQKELRTFQFGHIIADEVHRAKSRKAQQTLALKKLRAQKKTALSGTPVTNKPYDLWSILNWMYPEQYRSFWKFYERYCDYEIAYPHGYHKFLGPKNEEELLQTIAPYYRRHLKLQKCCEHHPNGVQPDLPEKYYTKIEVDLTPKQRKAYEEMKKEMIAWLDNQDETVPLVAPVVIAQLVRLSQLSVAYASIGLPSQNDLEKGLTSSPVVLTEPSSKLDALMQIIEDNEEEQIVVFSQFKGAIKLIQERLRRAKISYATVTGDVAASDRPNEIRRFQTQDARIFLGTIGAGGEGITLTSASTVVFVDRDWSPAKNAQAEDRLHRIGQRNAVQVIDIVSRDTVDQGRHQTLELKKSWIKRVLGDI